MLSRVEKLLFCILPLGVTVSNESVLYYTIDEQYKCEWFFVLNLTLYTCIISFPGIIDSFMMNMFAYYRVLTLPGKP